MINATLRSANEGNIMNVFHTAAMKNGYFVNLGAYEKDQVYKVAVPATATLATAKVLLVFNDETLYEEGKNITDGSAILANTISRAYYLAEGDSITFDDTLISGTAEAGKYLVPANATMQPTVADDMTGVSTALRIVRETTIGYNKRKAWEVVVEKA